MEIINFSGASTAMVLLLVLAVSGFLTFTSFFCWIYLRRSQRNQRPGRGRAARKVDLSTLERTELEERVIGMVQDSAPITPPNNTYWGKPLAELGPAQAAAVTVENTSHSSPTRHLSPLSQPEFNRDPNGTPPPQQATPVVTTVGAEGFIPLLPAAFPTWPPAARFNTPQQGRVSVTLERSFRSPQFDVNGYRESEFFSRDTRTRTSFPSIGHRAQQKHPYPPTSSQAGAPPRPPRPFQPPSLMRPQSAIALHAIPPHMQAEMYADSPMPGGPHESQFSSALSGDFSSYNHGWAHCGPITSHNAAGGAPNGSLHPNQFGVDPLAMLDEGFREAVARPSLALAGS